MKSLPKLRYLLLVTGLLLFAQIGLLQFYGTSSNVLAKADEAMLAPAVEPAVVQAEETPVSDADLRNPDIPPLAGGAPFVGPLMTIDKAAEARAARQLLGGGSGLFNIWYGDSQTFGTVGNPTPHINILGSISETTGISLSYSLNGGAEQPLNLGPDERRLWNTGDFNVEISRTLLTVGANVVTLFAKNKISNITETHTVNVSYVSGNQWPLPYTANWSTTTSINDIAQVVDGLWKTDGNTLDVVEAGYDRLVAMGDQNWTDYEVTVPVLVRGFNAVGGPSNGAGIGFIMRWPGHYATEGEQPLLGWRRLGALAWYRWTPNNTAGTEMRGFGGVVLDSDSSKNLQLDTQYMMKMSVQSVAGKPSYYRYKFWPANETEPALWDLESAGREGEPASGSLLLLAHNVDVSLGTVVVRPLDQIISTLNATTDGNGTIVASPSGPTYTYGQRTTLMPMGNIGFKFDRWTGDIESTDNPLIFNMTKDTTVQAHFVPGPTVTLTVNEVGPGSVAISPTKSSYQYNEPVRLTAVPESGFMLHSWSGDLSGNTSPVTITLSGNKIITATFGELLAPKSDDFNRCVLATADTQWLFEDPVGDGSYELNGQQLILNVPEGSPHNIWATGNNSVRVMAPIANKTVDNIEANFELEVKFDTVLTKTTGDRFQIQGILIEQDAENFLRFDFFNNNSEIRIFAGRIKNGVPFELLNQTIEPVPDGAMYMRVKRSGNNNTWTQYYSFDGINWTESGTFNYAISVTRAGVFAGNAGNNPAFTTEIDYIMNTETPIVSEDALPMTIQTTPVGQGTITANPAGPSYSCGEAIELSATPASGWTFAGWSGDASGVTNPLMLNFDVGLSITANFTETVVVEPENPTLYLPLIFND